jgi:hypothetical protein
MAIYFLLFGLYKAIKGCTGFFIGLASKIHQLEKKMVSTHGSEFELQVFVSQTTSLSHQ